MEELLVPLGAFAMIVALVWLNLRARSKRESDALATVRLAIDKGQAIDLSFMQSLTPKSDPHSELKVGVPMVGAGVGFVVFALAIGTIEPRAMAPLLGVSAFPFFIGLSLIGLHVFLRRGRDRE
jgi:hypothetical protein